MLLGQNVRNSFINADFSIWQRGTSFALNAQAYTADRTFMAFNADGGTVATGTLSRQLNTSSLSDQPYVLRIANTSVGSSLGVNSYHIIGQRVENVRTFSGKKVTISVWASSTISGKQLAVYAHQYFGSGGSAQVNIPGTVITLTSTMQRYDFTFTVPSISGKTIGSGDYLFIGVAAQFGSTTASGYSVSTVSWGGTGNVDILRWQINEGAAADFELAGGGDICRELILCQRYYWKTYGVDDPPGTPTVAGAIGSTDIGVSAGGSNTVYFPLVFPVKMRTNPNTLLYSTSSGAVNALWNASGGTNVSFSSVSINSGQSGLMPMSLTNASSTISSGQACQMHFTADAEL